MVGKSFRFFVLVLMFICIFANLISADFSLGNPNKSITEIYGPNSDIRGWINLSLKNEPINSPIKIFFDGIEKNSTTLENLLKSNSFYEYSCDTKNCGLAYFESNGESTKTIALTSGNNKSLGFQLNGIVISIDSINFEIQSNAGPACESQLKIDFFNNGIINFLNNKPSANVCSELKNYGCFSSSSPTNEFVYEAGQIYCQKVNLSEFPAFRVGAWIKKVSGSSVMNMTIYNINGEKKGSCSLPSIESSTGQEYFCDINYVVPEAEEHYICISSIGGDAKYRIRGNSNPPSLCGFPRLPPAEPASAYQIFAQGKQFDSFGVLKIENQFPDKSKISDDIKNYIFEQYGSGSGTVDCQNSNCIIPLNLIPSVNQQVTIRNIELKYSTSAGTRIADKIYDLTETAPLVNSNFQKINFDSAKLITPSSIGNSTLKIELGNKEIFSQKIQIKNVPIIEFLTPLKTAAGFPTEFSIKVTLPRNTSIIGYTWDFGDGALPKTTLTNKTSHIYSEIKKYSVKIGIIDDRGYTSERNFEVNVESPKNLINSTIERLSKNIPILENEIKKLSSLEQKGINEVLNLTLKKRELENIKNKFEFATNDSEYISIAGNALNLEIPERIFTSSKATSLIFVPEIDSVNLEGIQSIAGGNYDSFRASDYKNSILIWQIENLDVFMDYSGFSADYGNSMEPLVNVFNLRINKKTDVPYDYYLIIPKSGKIGVYPNISEEKDGFLYVNLKDKTNVGIYTTQDVGPLNLPVFIAPSLGKIELFEGELLPEDPPKSRLPLLLLILLLLIVIATVVYFVLEAWYRRKYEDYLFPNRNDLYNMVNYVNTSKKKNMTNSEIKKNLSKAGWSSEQIRYVMRKYEGKRTGMIGFYKKTHEIEKQKQIKQMPSSGHSHNPKNNPSFKGPPIHRK